MDKYTQAELYTIYELLVQSKYEDALGLLRFLLTKHGVNNV